MNKNRTFKQGDKVAMLNEPVKGTIVQISKDHIVILSEDDFEYECKISEIVHDFNFQKFLDEELDEEIKSKNAFSSNLDPKKGTKRNNAKSNILEVDLHIHELISSEKGMSNFEMLDIQLKTAKSKLELAIKNRKQRIIFIHGIGEGILKNELYKLFKKYPVEFYDASYKKYGRGATEVYIYQNKK